MKGHVMRIVGIVLFGAAFFVPAVRAPGTGAGTGSFAGWVCALAALMSTAGLLHLGAAGQGKDTVGIISLILSGWVNPLVLLFLAFSIRPRWVRTRRALTAAVVVCLAATWLFLFKAPMVPLVGHFLWVAGIAAILVAEFAKG